MREGDTVHLEPGTRHRLTAVEDTDIYEVSTPEMDDVVRLEDRYGRAPQ
jgi:quercetin dioxygenase-like cupin family protein